MGFEPATCDLRYRCSTIELRQPINKLERATGFEPAVLGLGSRCSTTEPHPHRKIYYTKLILKSKPLSNGNRDEKNHSSLADKIKQ